MSTSLLKFALFMTSLVTGKVFGGIIMVSHDDFDGITYCDDEGNGAGDVKEACKALDSKYNGGCGSAWATLAKGGAPVRILHNIGLCWKDGYDYSYCVTKNTSGQGRIRWNYKVVHETGSCVPTEFY